MIEVVNTRKDSACVWLSADKLRLLYHACVQRGHALDLNEEIDKADELYDMARDIVEVLKEVSDEESDN